MVEGRRERKIKESEEKKEYECMGKEEEEGEKEEEEGE